MVAGIWSITVARREATLTLTPLRPLDEPSRKALLAEAEQMAAFCRPEAASHRVMIGDMP